MLDLPCCPFCRGNALEMQELRESGWPSKFYVECIKCKAQGPLSDDAHAPQEYPAARQQAAERWSDRQT